MVAPLGDIPEADLRVELDNFILRTARPRSRSADPSTHMEEARDLGRTLFEHLMAKDVGDLYHAARRRGPTATGADCASRSP